MSNLTIRPIGEAEINWAVELAVSEGWNPGAHDMGAFLAQDPQGFLLGTLNDNPVGCIRASRYGSSYGSIGFHLVTPQMRGRGYGLQLWQAALKRLAGRCIGVDGLFSKQDFYRDFGFTFHYANIRHEYTNTATPDVTEARLVDAEVLPFNQLLQFDSLHFGEARPDFLRNWIHLPKATALGLRSAGALLGFGCIRRCRHGYKVGPLFAGYPQAAKAILFSLCARVPKSTSVYLDVPEKNLAACEICEEFSMRPLSAAARMYANGAPALPLPQIYGITTLDFG